MKRILIITAAAVVLVALGILGTLGLQQLGDEGSADADSVESSPSASATPATDDDETTPAGEPNIAQWPEEPEVKGKYDHSCDYLLGEALDDYWFVADATLYNTGNIGTVDRVTATWYLAGGETVTDQREVRNLPGKSKRVGFKIDATSDQIDQIMALDGDGMKTCDVKVKTLDTFGDVVED